MARSRSKQIKKVEKKIVPIEEVDPYLRILVYGRHGSQKTRFACTGPKPIIFDVNEKGTTSARRMHGAEVYPVNQWSDIMDGYWYMRLKGLDKYETVVIDSLTAMQGMCMKYVLGELEEKDYTRESDMPDRRSWGKMSEIMKREVLRFRNLPMHVVFTALERIVGDEDEPESHVPDLNPGTRGTVLAAVDVIGRTYVKEVRTAKKSKGKKSKEKKEWVPHMLVGPHDYYETKDRTGELGRIVKNPTVPLLLEAAGLGEEDATDSD